MIGPTTSILLALGSGGISFAAQAVKLKSTEVLGLARYVLLDMYSLWVDGRPANKNKNLILPLSLRQCHHAPPPHVLAGKLANPY